MLPDLRFVFGATLAIAMLAMAGLGLAISTQLLHEARIGSLEPTQSLAYAGQAEDNPFYDPNSVLRFTRALGKPDDPAVGVPPAEPFERPPAPPVPDEPVAVAADRTEASAAGDKAAEPAAARAIEPAAAETPPPEETKPPEAAERAAENGTPPAERERVAVAPAVPPAPDIRKDADGQPPVGENAQPTPAAKPVHHKPRPKVARAPRPGEQGFQSAGFPTGNTQWPSYGSPWGSPPATKKKNGTVAGW